jgi:hypothetical protein
MVCRAEEDAGNVTKDVSIFGAREMNRRPQLAEREADAPLTSHRTS